MKKLFKSMNDSQYHFSLRKMSVGVCSVVLGLFFVGVNNTQMVKADVIENTTAQSQTKLQQKVADIANSNSKVTTNATEVMPVKEASKVEENNLNVSLNNKETEAVNASSTVKSHEETLPKTTESQSKDNTNSEKTDSVLAKQSENDAQRQTQSVETNTLDLNSSNFKSNANVATSLLASRAMFYYVPYGGWENHNGKMYYRDWDGNYLRNQWAAPTGTTHYFGREGYTINNQWYTMPDNNTYYFDHTGHTVKNRWYTLPNTKTYYFDNTGHTVKNRWYTVSNNTTYYFDNFGHTVKNRWYNVSNNTYYFDNYGHTVKNRWYTLSNSKTYYFDTFGHTVKGRWYTLTNGSTYYFDTFGHTVKNRWYSIPNSYTYYFDNFGHTVKNRWYNIVNGGTYYFDNEGHTVKNQWYTINNIKYYFKTNGRTARDEAINIDGTNYVFDINGKHEHEVNIYYFDLNNGVLEVNSDSPTTYLTYKIINKDFMNKVLETTSFYGSVSEDLNKYVGINIEVQLSQMGNVIDSRQFYIASQTPQLSNLKIENNVLSGHVSGAGSLYIVNNGQRYFINDIGTYGSDFSCNILFLNGTPDPNVDVEVMVNGTAVTTSTLSVPVTLQRANVSNVSINENTLSGYVDRNAIVQVISSNGNTIAAQNIPDSGEWFNFDISAYTGSTITLQIVQNGGTVYSQDYDIPKKHALNSIKLPEGYTLSALQEAQDDPSSLAPVSEEGREENKFTSESAIDDQTQVDVSNLTSDQEEELSEFALKLINQAREQFGRPDWEYTDRVQKLANDVATEYVNNNQSGWDGHYVDGIVRAAQNNGLNISENEIEDISCTYGYPSSTITDLKNLVHNGIVNFLFSNYSLPEYYHAADILSGHKEEYWNDETLNAEFAISFTNVNNIVTVHFISVGSGKDW